jgi:hypothetical protein
MDLGAQADYDTGEVRVSRRRHDDGESIGNTSLTRLDKPDDEADLEELERAADRLLAENGLKRTGPWHRGRQWKIATTATEAKPGPTAS